MVRPCDFALWACGTAGRVRAVVRQRISNREILARIVGQRFHAEGSHPAFAIVAGKVCTKYTLARSAMRTGISQAYCYLMACQ